MQLHINKYKKWHKIKNTFINMNMEPFDVFRLFYKLKLLNK